MPALAPAAAQIGIMALACRDCPEPDPTLSGALADARGGEILRCLASMASLCRTSKRRRCLFYLFRANLAHSFSTPIRIRRAVSNVGSGSAPPYRPQPAKAKLAAANAAKIAVFM